jgi:hypothetical protein
MSATSHSQWDFLIRDSISAAEEVITICHDMRMGRIGLAKSSYIEYSSCRASLLVLLAHSLCCRTNEHSDSLQKGFGTIRQMASVSESAQSEVSLLEALEDALQRLHAFNQPVDQGTMNLANSSTQDGYEDLFNWYTSIAESNDPRPNARTTDATELSHARVRYAAPVQCRVDEHGSPITDMSSNRTTEEYPFDLDLLNVEGNIAFFTPNLNGYGTNENEMFENLLWPIRHPPHNLA